MALDTVVGGRQAATATAPNIVSALEALARITCIQNTLTVSNGYSMVLPTIPAACGPVSPIGSMLLHEIYTLNQRLYL